MYFELSVVDLQIATRHLLITNHHSLITVMCKLKTQNSKTRNAIRNSQNKIV